MGKPSDPATSQQFQSAGQRLSKAEEVLVIFCGNNPGCDLFVQLASSGTRCLEGRLQLSVRNKLLDFPDSFARRKTQFDLLTTTERIT